MGTLTAAGFVATWLSVVVAAAGLAVFLVAGVGLGSFFHEHRATRVRRHESVRAYYGRLALAH